MRNKWIIAAAAALLLAAPAFSQNYALPRTVVRFGVEAEREVFHAGPFAKYAQKYLGAPARLSDSVTSRIVGVSVSAGTEADPDARYVFPGVASRELSQLGAQGLVFTGYAAFDGSEWSFPGASKVEFTGAPSNLERVSGSLKKKGASSQTQSAFVEKSSEQRAKEAADRIFEIREYRYKILVGDTDATYSGEAMQAAVSELSAMENELVELFLGKSEFDTLKSEFEVVPDPSNQKQLYIPFRLSDENGPVGASNVEGSPFYLQLSLESVSAPEPSQKQKKPSSFLYYRVPAVCTARLYDASGTLLEKRIPIYQLGSTEIYPISTK